MPDNLPPYIAMFAKALRARHIAALLRRKDTPGAQRSAQRIEAGARFRLQRAKDLLTEDRLARGEGSMALSRIELMLVKAEYSRQMAAWLSDAPRENVKMRKSAARFPAVADFLEREARRMMAGARYTGRLQGLTRPKDGSAT